MAMIVVGIDGSEGSLRALKWALAEADVHGDSVRVVKAYWAPGADFAQATVPELYRPPRSGEDQLEIARRESERIIEQSLEKAAPPEGVRIEREAVALQPADALVARSSEARLVVVGSRGLGGFRALTLGSIGQQVVHHARCPVVVVPPER